MHTAADRGGPAWPSVNAADFLQAIIGDQPAILIGLTVNVLLLFREGRACAAPLPS